jgi:hypothetical protein
MQYVIVEVQIEKWYFPPHFLRESLTKYFTDFIGLI